MPQSATFPREPSRGLPGAGTTVDIIGFSRGAALALHFANRILDGAKVDGKRVKGAQIRFLGLWDVVPAFGLPGVILDWAKDADVGWELDFPEKAQRCSHAMARHERRQAFDVHRLDPLHKHPTVKEMWFRGVHSDVGGGNGNIPLNSIALLWMLEEARAAGIPFTEEQLSAVARLQEASAPISQNREVGDAIDRTFFPGDLIHSSASRKLEVGQSKLVSVDSRIVFDYSGLCVEKGQSYQFRLRDSDRWVDGTISCDSTGWPSELARNDHWWSKIREGLLKSRAVGMLRRVRSANWFELCACVGFDDEEAFPVGKGQFGERAWRCSRTGPLNFFANDALHPLSKYDNNTGSVSVNVVRVT